MAEFSAAAKWQRSEGVDRQYSGSKAHNKGEPPWIVCTAGEGIQALLDLGEP